MQNVWRNGNCFTLFPESDRYLPELLTSIDNASESVLVEQYLVESGEFTDRILDTLIRASGRGVHVQVLLDHVGSQGLSQADQRRLTAAGIALAFFNPLSRIRWCRNLRRDHRKLILIDRTVAYTGGVCFTDEFLGSWYDLLVRIEGPVVTDWLLLFRRLWNSPSVRGPHKQVSAYKATAISVAHPQHENMRGRVIWGRGRLQQVIRFSLQAQINRAKQRVWLYTPYFVPTFSLRQSLQQAAQRGVDVRVLVAGKNHDHPAVRHAGKSYYGRLLKAGVRIYEYQASFTHAKLCLVDDWCTLGSCNFDHWSLRWNLEANQEVDDRKFASEVAAAFESNLSRSHEITFASWRQRSLTQKLLRRVLGTLSAWMTLIR